MAYHTTEICRPDGTRLRIKACLHTLDYGSRADYSFTLTVCQPKKRTWTSVGQRTDHRLRGMTPQEQEDFLLSKKMEHITQEELHAAKMALWESIKPQ